MLKLEMTVYNDRNYLGKLVASHKGETFKSINVVAKSDPALKIANPPTGMFKLINMLYVPQNIRGTYGSAMMFFEAVDGEASRLQKKSERKIYLSYSWR